MSSFETQIQAFVSRAAELELWVYDRLINREDRVVRYHPTTKRASGSTYWFPYDGSGNAVPDPRTTGRDSTDEELRYADPKFLLRHFERGHLDDRSNLIVAPSTDPNTNTCRWFAFDVDQHEIEDTEKSITNWEIVQTIAKRLRSRGFEPVIEDSNGNGGFHIWVLLDKPTPSRDVFFLAREINSGFTGEIFPKQPQLQKNGCGNGLRLPGSHHTRDHASKFWNGTEWLEGAAAVEYLLNAAVNDSSLVPSVPVPPPRQKSNQPQPPADLTKLKSALDALPDEYFERYDLWLRVMLALARYSNDNPTLSASIEALATEFSENWEGFDAETFGQQWIGFLNGTSDERDDAVTVGSIFNWAKQAGWSYVPPLRLTHRITSVAVTKTEVVGDGNNSTKLEEETPPTPKEYVQEITLPTDLDLIGFEWNEVGNSERFAYLFSDQLAYVTEWGSWVIWNGRYWESDTSLRRIAFAKHMLRLMADEIDLITGDNSDRRRRDWRKLINGWSTKKGINNAIDLAQEKMSVSASRFDVVDPHLLNVQNGVVDLRSGKLLPHDPQYCFRWICPVAYTPDATSPRWQQFLDTVFEQHPDLIPFMARLLGYAATWCTNKQIMTILYGDGANGKSKLLEVFRHILGAGVVAPISIKLFVKTENSTNLENKIARLFGVRCGITEESEYGDILSEASIKSITGCSELLGRYLYKEEFSFTNTTKPFLVTNHLPVIQGGGHSIYRRLVVVPFSTRFWDAGAGEFGPDHLEQNPNIVSEILQEAPGVLAWVVAGAVEFFKSGLQVPESAQIAGAQYRAEQDRISRFMDECCEVTSLESKIALESGQYEIVEEVYQSYLTWCNQEGYKYPLSKPKFKFEIERGFKSIKYDRRVVDGERLRVWTNIKLRKDRGDTILFRGVESFRHIDWRSSGDAVPVDLDHQNRGQDHVNFDSRGQAKSIYNNDLSTTDHGDHGNIRVSDKCKNEFGSVSPTSTATEIFDLQKLSKTRGHRGQEANFCRNTLTGTEVTVTTSRGQIEGSDHGFGGQAEGTTTPDQTYLTIRNRFKMMKSHYDALKSISIPKNWQRWDCEERCNEVAREIARDLKALWAAGARYWEPETVEDDHDVYLIFLVNKRNPFINFGNYTDCMIGLPDDWQDDERYRLHTVDEVIVLARHAFNSELKVLD